MAGNYPYYNPKKDVNDFFDTKGGNSNFVSGSSVLVLLRAKLYSGEKNVDEDLAAGTVRVRGGEANVSNGIQRDILVGAGIRAASVDQQINITAEQGLGFFDIIEHVEHSVASNTFTIDKMMLRPTQLAKIGVAPFGLDVIRSPLLDCLITDGRLMAASTSKENYTVNFARLDGLHIQSNRMGFNTGTTVSESVTFRFDRMLPFNDGNSASVVIKQLKERFPRIYQNFEFEQVNIENMKKNVGAYFD